MMELEYLMVSASLSLSLLMMSVPVLERMRRRRGIFSACLGIILFRTVRSVFAECGWGFAAFAGAAAGLILETAFTAGGIMLSRELKECFPSSGEKGILAAVGVILVSSGRNLLFEYGTVADVWLFTAGEALELSLLVSAVSVCLHDGDGIRTVRHAGTAAVCPMFCALLELIVRVFNPDGAGTAAPMIIAMGTAFLITEVTERAGEWGSLSAPGFAAGLMIELCVGELAG